MNYSISGVGNADLRSLRRGHLDFSLTRSLQIVISIPRPSIQVDHVDLLMCQNTVDHPESTCDEIPQNQTEEERNGALIAPDFAVLQDNRF